MSVATLEPEAPAKEAAFAWGLDESSALARRLFEAYAGKPLPHWDRLDSQHRTKKADLISLLDPATGRTTIDPSQAVPPTPQDSFSALRTTLGYYGLGVAADSFSAESVHEGAVRAGDPAAALAPAGTKLSRALGPAIASMLRRNGRSLCDSLRCYYAGLDLIARWWRNRQKEGALDPVPTDEDLLPMVVGDVMEALGGGHKAAKLVLSANLLDLLTLSWNVPFVSCLAPNGQYRAATQQYANDDFTLVAYAYKQRRRGANLGDVSLPFKTWRQTVHVHLPTRSAAFMKPYGNPLPKGAHRQVVLEVARVIATSAGLAFDTNPAWLDDHFVVRKAEDNPYGLPVSAPRGGAILASVDQPAGPECSKIHMKDGGTTFSRPLAWPLPCTACPTGTITQHNRLVCRNC